MDNFVSGGHFFTKMRFTYKMLLLGVVLIVGISAKKFVATEEDDAAKKVSVCRREINKMEI